MTMAAPTLTSATSAEVEYRALPLLELTRRIAEHGDVKALCELHNNRPVFRTGAKLMLFTQYLAALLEVNQRWVRRHVDIVVLEKAYDMTMSKFVSLPDHGGNEHDDDQPTAPRSAHSGINCRFYFTAFLGRARKTLARDGMRWSPLRQELELATLLCRFVHRHFILSCLECARRARGLQTLYKWRTRSGIIRVWLPAGLGRSSRRAWLEQNVPNPDASRPGEQDRVQRIVHRRLTTRRIMSLTSLQGSQYEVASRPSSVAWEDWLAEPARKLAEVTADEKARHIANQRRAIRKLGPVALRDMILQIFQELYDGTYEAGVIANRFGISAATFSRYCGIEWLDGEADLLSRYVPDLWRNVAELLAGNPGFVQAAKTAGVWDTIQTVVRRPEKGDDK